MTARPIPIPPSRHDSAPSPARDRPPREDRARRVRVGVATIAALAVLASATAASAGDAPPPPHVPPASAPEPAPSASTASARRIAETRARVSRLLLEMESLGLRVADVRDGKIVLVAAPDQRICMPPGPRPSLTRQPVDLEVLAHAVSALQIANKHLGDHSEIEIAEADPTGACWTKPITPPPPPPASAPAPAVKR